MHGRLKIKTTAEQQAEKEKERAAKLKLYTAGLNAIFSKKRDNVHDKEALTISAQLLAANPDAVTLWNFRREVLLTYKSELEEGEWQKLLEDDLKSTEYCLLKNPKSYGVWHHRDWLFKAMPSPVYSQELEMCNRYLQKDERNFHCWDHRRLIVSRSERSLADELSLTQNLIEQNFSNYSAWHYRSKLLPLVHPPPKDCPHPIPENIFLQELQKVVTAVFTDPSDQSPWFFLQWLLGKRQQDRKLVQVGLMSREGETQLVLVFATEVFSCAGLTVLVQGQEVSLEALRPHLNKSIWLLPLSLPEEPIQVKLVHEEWDAPVTLEAGLLGLLPKFQWVGVDPFGLSTLSPETRKSLDDILDSCITLEELDPGNKWVLLSLVNIMSMMGPSERLQRILGYLDQLQSVDPLRVRYYKDLRSKIQLDAELPSAEKCCGSFDLSCRSLTRLVRPQFLSSLQEIDLSGNEIRSLSPVCAFLNCRRLILDRNPVADLSPVKHLSALTDLRLNSCGIREFAALEGLRGIPGLRRIELKDNSVTGLEDFGRRIKEVVPSLEEVIL